MCKDAGDVAGRSRCELDESVMIKILPGMLIDSGCWKSRYSWVYLERKWRILARDRVAIESRYCIRSRKSLSLYSESPRNNSNLLRSEYLEFLAWS